MKRAAGDGRGLPSHRSAALGVQEVPTLRGRSAASGDPGCRSLGGGRRGQYHTAPPPHRRKCGERSGRGKCAHTYVGGCGGGVGVIHGLARGQHTQGGVAHGEMAQATSPHFNPAVNDPGGGWFDEEWPYGRGLGRQMGDGRAGSLGGPGLGGPAAPASRSGWRGSAGSRR